MTATFNKVVYEKTRPPPAIIRFLILFFFRFPPIFSVNRFSPLCSSLWRDNHLNIKKKSPLFLPKKIWKLCMWVKMCDHSDLLDEFPLSSFHPLATWLWRCYSILEQQQVMRSYFPSPHLTVSSTLNEKTFLFKWMMDRTESESRISSFPQHGRKK